MLVRGILRGRHGLSAGILLAAFLSLTVAATRQKSMVTDEMVTFLPGYAYLRTGDFRLTFEHPPLSKYIAAVPLLFLNPDLPLDHPAWREANAPVLGSYFIYHNRVDAGRIIFWGRMGIVACGFLLGILVYLWAARLFGGPAGLMALFLFCFSPDMLAHAGLATSDMAAACFIFLAVFSLWRFCRCPGRRRLLTVAACLALAQLSKFSALLLFPIYVILYGAAYLSPHAFPALRLFAQGDRPPRSPAARFLRAAVPLTVIFCCAAVMIWAAYGFETAPLSSLAGGLPTRLLDLPCPAPSFVRGVLFQVRHAAEGHPAFLMGRYSTTGWWYYFPVAFLIKTPLPALILLALAVILFKKIHAPYRDELFIAIPPLLFFLSCMLGHINIGVRYILPVYPFLFVFTSRLAALDFTGRRLLRACLLLLCAWYLASALWIFPHYLAYFNELVGGPRQGYRYLVDSNLDWGQDVKGLKRYMEQHRIPKVWACGLYEDVLRYHGIDYALLPADGRGVSGYVAVSAMDLQCVRQKDKHALDWLKRRESVAAIGYSIFVYQIPSPPHPDGSGHGR